MAYADYSYYREQYYGERLDEKSFPRYAGAASAYLDRITFDRARERAESDSVMLACCAVADEMASCCVGRVSSEMVGNWSRAYRLDDSSAGKRLYTAASLYLVGTGLLYRGCC